MRIFLFICLLFPVVSHAATYGPCTDGTDCYCDQVADSGSDIYDASMVFCEDFDAAVLASDTGAGDGAPNYGPWYDDTGDTGNRGFNSYWNKNYGNPVSGLIWNNGEPATPTVGPTCADSPFCVGALVWHPDDLWDTDQSVDNAAIVILTQDSDFTAEIGTLAAPTNTATGGDGIFDGNASFGHRVPQGETAGILGDSGSKNVWAGITHIGCTMAVAMADNFSEAEIYFNGSGDRNWKWNEFSGVNQGVGYGLDPLCGYGYAPDAGDPSFPIWGFIGHDTTEAICNSDIINNATLHVGGALQCTDIYVSWLGADADYTYSADWGDAQWGCSRTEFNMSTGLIKMWIQTPSMSDEKLVFHASGIDWTGYPPAAGYDRIIFNAYANVNVASPFSTATTFRYEDNVHITNGTPVSCAAIGYGQSTPTASKGVSFSYFREFMVTLGLLGLLLAIAVGIKGIRGRKLT